MFNSFCATKEYRIFFDSDMADTSSNVPCEAYA